jgi:glycosyltransferase involved in cell wall biosynthesis
LKVLLVGNYAPDRQQSMQRYAAALADGLALAGHAVRLCLPRARLDARGHGAVGAWKWLGYADKLVFAPGEIRRASHWADVVHVCDHSNAPYVPSRAARPWVVTCHDLLAVRGALGEDTDCPASAAGRLLQRMIRAGLERASAVVAVSEATRRDVQRLIVPHAARTLVVPPPLNYPFVELPPERTAARLAPLGALRDAPYVLLVGSNLRRKNRACAVRVLGRLRDRWLGRFVFAGEPLAPELRREAERLGVADRVVDVPDPSGELLEALYNGATCLLFPSRFEGFGWPIVEAQACGCPVVVSDAPPLPDVAGGAAIVCGLDREQEFDAAILALSASPAARRELAARGRRNAADHRPAPIVSRLVDVYERVARAAS